MQISIAKKWSIRKLCDENGFFKMASLDQRPPIEEPILAKISPNDNLNMEIVKFKHLLIEAFQDKSSSMLLDPSFAVAGCLDALDAKKGLLISLEDPYSTKTSSGATMTSPIKYWSVGKIKRIGGDGVKLLIWYHPDGEADINLHQQKLVKKIGDDCIKYDIPFILELLSYPLNQESENFCKNQSDIVLNSVKEFAKPIYNVDIFMVESPIDAANIMSVGDDGWENIQDEFNKLAKYTARPWVMLSMGADMAQFYKIMTYAYHAGASGYLAGRAYWLDTLSYYPDWQKMLNNTKLEAQNYINELNILTDKKAKAWHRYYNGYLDEEPILDGEFCKSYNDI